MSRGPWNRRAAAPGDRGLTGAAAGRSRCCSSIALRVGDRSRRADRRPGHADGRAGAAALRRRDGLGRDRPRLRRRSTFAVGGGVAVFDCNGDGKPDMYLAGGQQPGRALPQRQPGRRRPAVQPAPRSGHGPHRRHRRLPARHRRRRHRRPGGPARRRERPPARPRRLPVRARERGLGFDGERPDDGVQRDLGRLGGLPTLAVGHYLRSTAARPTRDCADNQLVRPSGGGLRLRAAVPWLPGYCAAVDALQRLGPIGPARPAGQQRPPLLRRRRGAALAGRARRGAAPLHRRRRLGERCRSGAWASPATTSPATATRTCS